MKKAYLKTLSYIIPLLLGVFVTFLMFSSFDQQDYKQFLFILSQIDYFNIIIALLLSLFSYLIRANRWKYALHPLGYTSTFNIRYHSMMIGYLVNFIFPRAGEASRAYMLHKANKTPVFISIGSIIFERIIDLILLFFIGLISYILSVEKFNLLYSKYKIEKEKHAIDLYFYILLVIIVISSIVFRKKIISKFKEILLQMKKGVFSVLTSGFLFNYIFQTLLIWILYVLFYYFFLKAFYCTEQLRIDAILLSFVAGALSVSITNGGLGVFPILVGFVLCLFMEEKFHTHAYIVAFIIWFIQSIFVIFIGLFSLIIFRKNT